MQNLTPKEDQIYNIASGTNTLQSFMTQVYSWMSLGLALTGFMAFLTISIPQLAGFVFGNRIVFIGLIIAEIGMVILFTRALVKQASFSTLLSYFLIYSLLNGLTFSVYFLVYTSESIASVFFITAGMFGGMSIYGFVTKRNLTGIGQFAAMGIWGVILMMVVNLFMHSSVLDTSISLIAVGIFVILTAYDTQKLKAIHSAYANDEESLRRLSLQGALMLYLDFINLFIHLLRLMGRRK